MPFKTIETQEQLNAIISERLSRAEEKYEGYTSPEDVQKIKDGYDQQIKALNDSMDAQKKKYSDYDNQLAEKDKQIRAYETASVKTRIAHDAGLPYEMASRLSGETEEEIKEDAESLARLIGNRNQSTPLANHEDNHGDGSDASYVKLLRKLKGE